MNYVCNAIISRSAYSSAAHYGLPPPFAALSLLLHRYSSSLLVRSGTDNTEAQVIVPIAGVVAEPGGNLAVVVVAVVRAAATVIAEVDVVRVDTPAPLPNIAAHVVESVAVCLFLCYWMSSISAVAFTPAYFIKIIAS